MLANAPSGSMRSPTSRWSCGSRGWFYWPTYGEKGDAKGPYTSMASVTLMIARELKREITKRDGPYSTNS